MHRRGFLFGLGGSFVATPTVVRKGMKLPESVPIGDGPWNVTPLNVGDVITLEGQFHRITAVNPSPRPIADESV